MANAVTVLDFDGSTAPPMQCDSASVTDATRPIGWCAGCGAALVFRLESGGYTLGAACGCSEVTLP